MVDLISRTVFLMACAFALTLIAYCVIVLADNSGRPLDTLEWLMVAEVSAIAGASVPKTVGRSR